MFNKRKSEPKPNDKKVEDLQRHRKNKAGDIDALDILEDAVVQGHDAINAVVVMTKPNPDNPARNLLFMGHSTDDAYKTIGMLEAAKATILEEIE